MRAVLAAAALVLAGCGDDAVPAARLDEIRGMLASDASRALAMVQESAAGRTPSPRLALLGAEACLRLDRRDDALAWAERGLDQDDVDEAVACQLQWAQGTALVGRYRDLHAEADRRLANAVLERATVAGPRVADAAFLLVLLQEMATPPDGERQRRFARVFLEREPDGPRAQQVRDLLAAKGLTP